MANITATLRKKLQACSAAELAGIGEKWAVTQLKTDGMPTGEIEGAGLLDIIHARFAWEALSPGAREILHQMITFQIMDGVPREDLQKLAQLTDVEFVTALTQLEQSLMLIETRPDAKVRQRLETRGQQANYVLAIPKDFYASFSTINQEIYEIDRTKLPLAQLLASLDPAKLQVIEALSSMQSRDSGFSFYTAASTPTSLAAKLAQADVIAGLWEKLDETEREICRWLCRADGSAQMADVQSALNLSRPTMARHVYRLESYGLVFSAFSGQEYKLFIDHGTFKTLRKLINELEKLRERAKEFSAALQTGEKPPVVHETHSQLLSDLAIVVNAVHQMVIEPTQSGNVPKRLAGKIFPLLHGSRPMYYEETDYYLDMVFSIANSLDLIHLQHSASQKSRYMPGPKLKEWTQLEAFEQARRLLTLWQTASDRSWSDVAGVNYRPDSYGYGYYIESSSSRQGLLGYLAEQCQPEKWYVLSTFLQSIKELHPLLLREHSRYSTYGGQRNRKEVLSRWNTVDAEIITGMLSSSLYELGLVTLGYQSEPDMDNENVISNPDAFQFTELAAQVIWDMNKTKAQTSASQRPRTLIVQPNFELLLLQPDYPTLYKVLPFSKVNQVEMVSRLTLTQESIRRGVEAGYGVEQIISTLQECSQKELPQNVLYTLQDWGRLYKNATISQMIVIEVSNETIADELYTSPKLRSLELRRLGSCTIAVGGQVSLQVLRTTLEKDGIILHIQGDILNAREVASASTSGYGKRR